jgi:hypothetical protein
LQAFTFCSGFAIVTASGTVERKRFKCVHHQQNPCNTRKLKDIPVSPQEYHEAEGIGEEGNNLRLHNGLFRGLHCKREVYIARRAIRGTGKRENFWTIRITQTGHSHQPLSNLFSYLEHEKIHPHPLEMREGAIKHRNAGLTLAKHREVTEIDNWLPQSFSLNVYN